jgi:WD40 repeat protein
MAASRLDISDNTIALTSGKSRLWAILVGVNAYQDDQIPVLRYSAADCRALAEVLAAATRQFPKKQIIAHHDSGAQLPVRAAVSASFAQVIEQAKPQDTVLFYFSGHGLIEPESKRAVLCLSDTQTDRLLDTGLQMHELLHWLDQCESRQQLVWLDACHSGELMIPGSRNVVFDTAIETTTTILRLLRQQAIQNKGLYALLSCDQGQRSWEFPELGHGLFTYYLIQGLAGEAADEAGIISADGLYQYLYKQIVEFIHQKNQSVRRLNEHHRQIGEVLMYPEYPLQTPKRIIDGVGNVVVGLRRKASSTQPLASQSNSNQVKATRTPTNPTIPWHYFWHYLLWGWVAAVGIGGLYWAAQSVLSRSVLSRSEVSVDSIDPSTVCNLNIELTEPISKPAIEPQILLNGCGNLQSWQPVKAQALLEDNPIWTVAFRDNNSLFAAGDGNISIRNLATPEPPSSLGNHTDSIYGMAISSTEKQIATASADQTAKIWNAPARTLQHTLKGHSAAIWSIDFSPDDSTIATGSVDNTVKLWNTSTGKLNNTLTGHQDWVFAVTYSPKGDMLASASKDHTIKLWDQNGTELKSLTGHENAVRAIAFSRDGDKLASASWDRTVKIWDVQTGQVLQTLSGHTDRVVTVAFSPDGETLASGSIDQTIKLWRSADGTPLATLYGQTDWILTLDFSPDGKTLASGSRDQTILLWREE